jgi:YD repeat-containing protein
VCGTPAIGEGTGIGKEGTKRPAGDTPATELLSGPRRAVEQALRDFEAAWQASGFPQPDDFLPPDPAVRRAVLVELVHADLGHRLQAGEPARAEDYLGRYPELAADRETTLQLIVEEYELRRRWEPALTAAEYLRRFPQLREEITSHLGLGHVLEKSGAPGEASGAGGFPAIPSYEILTRLGQGGMGVVYQARHRASQRLFAIKMLRDVHLAGPQLMMRFRAEADALARLRHPHIVQFFEAGQHGDNPYFVMELVTGASLDRLLAGQPQPVRTAAELIEKLARAVHAAHREGVIHRDLKPANILLQMQNAECIMQNEKPDSAFCILHSAFCIPKVTDFGLAKQLDADVRQTSSGAILGTPQYMAPEQAAGKRKEVGPATDVYALGVILYEMLTGRPPFSGPNTMDVLLRVQTQDPASPRQIRPDVPRDLEVICLKCLRKGPSQRYPAAADLADDLRRFLEDRPVRARPVGLWERAVKLRRRRPVTAALAASGAALLLLAAAVAVWYWDACVRVKIEYYANLVKRRGVPEGVGPLSAAQAHRRPISFRLSRRGGQVEQVEVVNGQGELTTHHPVRPLLGRSPAGLLPRRGVCRYVYQRRQDGSLEREEAFDRYGNLLWGLHYTTPMTAFYTDARGYPRARTGSGAAYVEFVWSEEGFAREIHYQDRNGSPHPNDEAVFGLRQQFDARGLVVHGAFLDSRNRPFANKYQKYTSFQADYNARGDRIELAYFAGDGKPVVSKDGFAGWTGQYDEAGNLVEEAFFGAGGRPFLNAEGVARTTITYDVHGNDIGRAYFGTDGRPVLHRDGYARVAGRFDHHGNLVVAEYFGVDGRPIGDKDGVAQSRMRYDDHGNRTEEASFGLDGKPILNKNGNARFTARYDARGNLVETATFGRDGRPVLDKKGYARTTAEYDRFGNQVAWAFFGTDGQPILTKAGFARLKMQFDDRGNQTGLAHYGRDGRLAADKDGIARFQGKYDDRGYLTEKAYFGVDGQPARNASGTFRVMMHYDDRGNLSAWEFFGPDGRRAANRSGVARVTAQYDEAGNRIEEGSYDTAGRPVINSNGYFRFRACDDDRGNRIAEAYFDAQGQPANHALGFHRATTRYDEQGNPTETAYWGADGRLIASAGRYAKMLQQYDRRGQVVQIAFRGPDDLPVLYRGAARTRLTRDERGNVIAAAHFGTRGDPVHQAEGYARFTAQFDARDNEKARAFFGTRGQPVLNPNGVHRIKRKYDERDRPTEEACFDTHGKPVLNKQGFARVTKQYDERDRLVIQAFFGTDGKPVIAAAGFARLAVKYDEQGNLIDRTLFDRHGHAIAMRTVIVFVQTDGPGTRLGLRPGDILATYGSQPVVNSLQFLHRRKRDAGDRGTKVLGVVRRGKPVTVQVPARGDLGMQLRDVPALQRGETKKTGPRNQGPRPFD